MLGLVVSPGILKRADVLFYRKLFGFSSRANGTGVGFFAFFGECCFFGNFAVVPGVSGFVRNLVAFAFAYALVPMLGLIVSPGVFKRADMLFYRKLFGFSSRADRAGVGFFALFGEGRLFCNFAVVPGVSGFVRNLVALAFAYAFVPVLGLVVSPGVLKRADVLFYRRILFARGSRVRRGEKRNCRDK